MGLIAISLRFLLGGLMTGAGAAKLQQRGVFRDQLADYGTPHAFLVDDQGRVVTRDVPGSVADLRRLVGGGKAEVPPAAWESPAREPAAGRQVAAHVSRGSGAEGS